MLTLNCPACGAGVNFQSKASVFAVCSYCKSSLVRQGMDLDAVGKISELGDDLTPIQTGTTGMFEEEKFEVIGRMKIGYSNGFWNEWFTLLGSGKVGWLVEAQGFYALCYPFLDVSPPAREVIRPEKKVFLGDTAYLVEDIREVVCLHSEGELPVDAVEGRRSTSVDLTGFDDSMATIEYAQKETRVFIGAYKDFDLFQFKNLRPLDGW